MGNQSVECWKCGEESLDGNLCDFCRADMENECSMCGAPLKESEVVRCSVCEKNLVELLSE